MERKKLAIGFIPFLLGGLVLSIIAFKPVANRTPINENYRSDIERLFEKSEHCFCRFSEYATFTDYRYKDENDTIKNYLKSLAWERCNPKRTYLSYEEEHCDYISVECVDFKIFFYELRDCCYTTWNPSTLPDFNIISAEGCFKFNKENFDFLRQTILDGGTKDEKHN